MTNKNLFGAISLRQTTTTMKERKIPITDIRIGTTIAIIIGGGTIITVITVITIILGIAATITKTNPGTITMAPKTTSLLQDACFPSTKWNSKMISTIDDLIQNIYKLLSIKINYIVMANF
jgi:hypothetical protein